MRRMHSICSRGNTTREGGQAMVEFALVAVFLFLLIVSIIQMILLMYAHTTLANAAKEGVRYAIVHGTGNTVCSGPICLPALRPWKPDSARAQAGRVRSPRAYSPSSRSQPPPGCSKRVVSSYTAPNAL